MSKIITIDPVTRISGFMNITVETKNNKITQAKCSGTLYRGFESILVGRSPLDAIYFTERICGICSTAHSMTATLALEDALKIEAPLNSKMIRDVMHGCEFLQNHIRHFYLYCLPDYVVCPNISPVYPTTFQDFRIPKELSEKIGENYIKALNFSKLAHEMLALLGAKAPHNHGIFVGGVTVNITAYKIEQLKSMLSKIKDFVFNNMIEDANTIASYYKDYFKKGISYYNFMSYGIFNNYKDNNISYVSPSVIIDGKREAFHDESISENICHSWYSRENQPDMSKEDAYSFVKAPRYKGNSMVVGPLARMILSGNYPLSSSTMDRILARVKETMKIITIMENLLNLIQESSSGQNVYEIPNEAYGKGLTDTLRGSLGHWVNIKDKKIEHYDIITPTAWNGSPKDCNNVAGPIEEALLNTFMDNENNPVEIGRIVRSFDPCISCGTHMITKNSVKDFILV